jgi:hypothetical protein
MPMHGMEYAYRKQITERLDSELLLLYDYEQGEGQLIMVYPLLSSGSDAAGSSFFYLISRGSMQR